MKGLSWISYQFLILELPSYPGNNLEILIHIKVTFGLVCCFTVNLYTRVSLISPVPTT